MSKICKITKKRPIHGNNRSHAMNATKRRFIPNLHTRKIWVSSKKIFIKIKISSKGLKTIDKNGIETYLKQLKNKK